MESTLSHPSYIRYKPFDIKEELLRLKLLAEALTACVSNDKKFTYEYLHQLSILPTEQQFMLVRFSGVPHHGYEQEFEGFIDAMKFLVLSIRRIEEQLEKEEMI